MSGLVEFTLPAPRRWGVRRVRSGLCKVTVAPQLGVDLVSIARLRAVFEGKPALADMVFTREELRYANAQRRPFMHLAARYAAKEAVLKALGTGFTSEMDWREIETVHGPSGAPRVSLRGAVARVADSKGLRRCAVSLTHAGAYAMAAVLLTP
jgi:holo-[acyl-carrier protein] synthase